VDGSPATPEREKIIMRIPQQVPERVKEAPAQALRAVFSGIGQVLLVADRIKNRGAEPERAQPVAAAPAAPSSPAQSSAAQAAPAGDTRWRSLDQTGNVRLLSEQDPSESAAEAEPTATPEPAATAEPPAEPTAAAGPTAAEPPADQTVMEFPATEAVAEAPATEQAALPVPNYDDLSVASLRARLRNLDQSQVRMLLDYEKAHAGRADVLAMFERRITKLENGA
jgi:hypothetical protein